MKLRVSPGFDPLKAQVGPDEYFLLSRIDGSQTLREVILSTGLPVERAVVIVTRLRSIGALLLPGETAPPAAPVATPPAATPPTKAPPGIAVARTATPMTPMGGGKLPGRPTPPAGVPVRSQDPPPVISRTTTPAIPMPPSRMPAKPAPQMVTRPPTEPQHRPSASEIDPPTIQRHVDPPTQPRSDLRKAPPPPPADMSGGFDHPTVRRAPAGDINVVLPNPTDIERAALAEPGAIEPDVRLRILAMARLVDAHDPWALLGVPHGADVKTLKRAYYKLSKDIHPDRFFGRQLGSFADRLSLVFEAVSRAYAKLTQPEKSAPSGREQAVSSEQPQTPQEYAAELFQRACALEVGGDALGAMKLFAASVRIDPQTRYLRRAASCALAAEQPKTALEYAKKAQTQAPNDPSCARLLASAFKATGKYSDAEEVLIMAMAIKSENDVLGAELRNDLAEVRRLLSG